MGEYVMTTVSIGGPLKDPQAVAELIAATGRYFAETERLVREALAEGASVTSEDLQDFGVTPTSKPSARSTGCRTSALGAHATACSTPACAIGARG